MSQFFFMAVAYGSGRRILLLSDDVNDSGPGYSWSFLTKKGISKVKPKWKFKINHME